MLSASGVIEGDRSVTRQRAFGCVALEVRLTDGVKTVRQIIGSGADGIRRTRKIPGSGAVLKIVSGVS